MEICSAVAVLPLGKGSIQISPEREAYNALRQKYESFAEKAKQDFLDRFAEHFIDMDQLHERCSDVAQQYLVEPIDKAIRDLVNFGVMNIDDERFKNTYLLPILTWKEDISEIDEKYLEIVLKAKELAAYRTARSENRGGVIGGGFGLEGAAQGWLAATAINTALVAVGGAFNWADKTLSEMGDKRKKSYLYEAPSTRAKLADSVYRLVSQVHLALVDAVKDLLQKCPFDKVSEEDSGTAERLRVNISKGRITGEEAEKRLIESLTLNPYEPESYLLWLDRYGDEDGLLGLAAQHFGIWEVSERKDEMLLRYEAGLNLSSLEECEISLAKLTSYAFRLGKVNIDREREYISAEIDRFDRERRTFNGVLYESLEEARAAEIQWESDRPDRERRTFNGTLYETLEEAQAAEMQWKDEKSRTFNGTLFATLAETQDAKNEFCRRQAGLAKQNRLALKIIIGLVVLAFILAAVAANRELRTFNGKTYETAEAAQIAKDQWQERSTFNGILYATPAEALAAKTKLEDEQSRTVNGILYETVEAALEAKSKWEDEQNRTVNGIIYETLEAAAKAKEEDEQSRTVNGKIYETLEEAQTAKAKKDETH